ncbi:DUF5994 family protein [Catellatospora sichuanensis]|uniref:DUF5994 family protein n=1 Tax=Catellatospora sichuanensis TaxID=1969805 RepID=UPI001183EF7B|nr:DUF5994 family protein [Catellatospora sichuanensis]
MRNISDTDKLAEIPTTRAGTPPARVSLTPRRADRAVLDGGWWPRSWNPAVELPALVTALSQRYGPIRHLMLNDATWPDHIRRLTVGSQVVRIGWFATQDPALAIALTARDEQLDLLVVPPSTPTAAAERALAAAADPADLTHAADIIAALTAPDPAGTSRVGAPVDGGGRNTAAPVPAGAANAGA